MSFVLFVGMTTSSACSTLHKTFSCSDIYTAEEVHERK